MGSCSNVSKSTGAGGDRGLNGEVDFAKIISASPVSINFSGKSSSIVIDSRNPNGTSVYSIKGKSLDVMQTKFPDVDDFVMDVREGRQKDNAMKLFSELGYEPKAWHTSDVKYLASKYYMVKKQKKR